MVIFESRGFSLPFAAEHHPVVAIVMHGPVINVKTKIIDEVIRKNYFSLIPSQFLKGIEAHGPLTEQKRQRYRREKNISSQ